jgi:hypothetical protein
MDSMRAVFVTALLCLAATGCASSIVHPTPYPAEWPERSGLTGCAITGAYQDLGELQAITITSPQYRRAHLSSLLRAGDTGAFNDLASPEVHVWLDRDSPKMRVGPEHSAETEQLRSEGGVVCESDGALTLRFESDTGSAYRHAVTSLWNGADGSLIVRMDLTFTEKGLPGLLPDSREVIWFRFLRMGP